MKHTPAPWRFKLSGETVGKSHIIHDDSKYPNGMFGLCHVFGDTLEQEHANARLIAACPKILTALKGCRDALANIPEGIRGNHDSHINRQLERAINAINEAEGK